MKTIRNILLDLDGTIIDSSPGIFRCFRATLAEMSLPERTDAELSAMIGPPLAYGMSRLIESDDEMLVERAVQTYRKYYGAGGMFEVTVYPGIQESVQDLHGRGYSVYCVTGKAKPFAEKILEHIGLSVMMKGVYGPDLNSRTTEKADLVNQFLRDSGAQPSECVMIGDRKFDVEGASLCGVRSIGITWGFGSRDELEEAGADAVIDSADTLHAAVLALD